MRELFKQQQRDMQALFSSWAAVLADRVTAVGASTHACSVRT